MQRSRLVEYKNSSWIRTSVVLASTSSPSAVDVRCIPFPSVIQAMHLYPVWSKIGGEGTAVGHFDCWWWVYQRVSFVFQMSSRCSLQRLTASSPSV